MYKRTLRKMGNEVRKEARNECGELLADISRNFISFCCKDFRKFSQHYKIAIRLEIERHKIVLKIFLHNSTKVWSLARQITTLISPFCRMYIEYGPTACRNRSFVGGQVDSRWIHCALPSSFLPFPSIVRLPPLFLPLRLHVGIIILVLGARATVAQ